MVRIVSAKVYKKISAVSQTRPAIIHYTLFCCLKLNSKAQKWHLIYNVPMKILLTHFDPFGEEKINASAEVAAALPSTLGDISLDILEVPTVFGTCFAPVEAALQRQNYDAVICLGQAKGRNAITPERVAINIDDARIDDNAGKKPEDEVIAPEGPAAYFSTLPLKNMVEAIKAAGVSAAISNSAGTFVCNHLLYQVLHHCATKAPSTRACFIHLPALPKQVQDTPEIPSFTLEDMAKGLKAAFQSLSPA